jgi:DNA-binding transcriptional LysR family regulator
MADRLTAIEVFVRIVEEGSLTAAGARLGLSRAAVSKHLVALEDRLGVRLLNRTTRRCSLTEAGSSYHDRARQILAELAEAEREAGRSGAQPTGRLRLNAPMTFGTMHLAPAIPGYCAAHPAVTVDMTLNDRLVDLVEEGFDLAVRIGRLADSSLVARRLAPCRFLACAAPSYLAARGRPAAPEELEAHACLGYSYAPGGDIWEFTGPDGPRRVRVSGPMRANNGEALAAAAAAGLGIVLSPSFIVSAHLRAGRLVPVLEGYAVAERGIFAVWPAGRHLSAKVRSFVDFLVGRFGPTPYWDR